MAAFSKDIMKTGWLIVSGCLSSDKFKELYEFLSDAATVKKIKLEIKKNSDFTVCVTEDSVVGMDERPDFVLFWDKDVDLAYAFELMNIPVFNSSEAIYLCDDKFRTHRALSKYDIPMPKTFKVPFSFKGMAFSDYSFIDNIEKELDYPLVIKCTNGSFGEQVYLCNNRLELIERIENHVSEPMIIQEYIKTESGKDLRMYMVGDTLAAAIIRTNEKDFRANIHLGGYGTAYTPDESEIALAYKIMQILGLDFAGIDFLFDKDKGLVLCEVNSNAHFRELYDVTGVNAAENIIEYIDDSLKKY